MAGREDVPTTKNPPNTKACLRANSRSSSLCLSVSLTRPLDFVPAYFMHVLPPAPNVIASWCIDA